MYSTPPTDHDGSFEAAKWEADETRRMVDCPFCVVQGLNAAYYPSGRMWWSWSAGRSAVASLSDDAGVAQSEHLFRIDLSL